MRVSRIFIAPIKGYQYISRMLPASCRYYPTCSEYAKWQFEFNRADLAFISSTLRILRCNQLFRGGIDYPKVRWKPPKVSYLKSYNYLHRKIKIKYWLIPIDKKNYIVIKAFNE